MLPAETRERFGEDAAFELSHPSRKMGVEKGNAKQEE